MIDDFTRRTSTDVSVAVPIGTWIHVSDNTYVNISYTPYWIPDSPQVKPITHVFMAGLTFRFGGSGG